MAERGGVFGFVILFFTIVTIFLIPSGILFGKMAERWGVAGTWVAGALHDTPAYLAAKYFPLPAAPTDRELLQRIHSNLYGCLKAASDDTMITLLILGIDGFSVYLEGIYQFAFAFQTLRIKLVICHDIDSGPCADIGNAASSTSTMSTPHLRLSLGNTRNRQL